jgi:hypothetical protein
MANIVTVDGIVVRRLVSVGTQGPPGPAGPVGTPFRGLTSRTSSGTIAFTGVTIGDYINSGLTGTLDNASAEGTAAAGANKFGLTRTDSGTAWCHVIATADVAGAANKRIGIKLAVNGAVIDASECNITITATTIGKLHTMFLLELDEDDEVTVWFANYTNQQAITIERARLVLFGVV